MSQKVHHVLRATLLGAVVSGATAIVLAQTTSAALSGHVRTEEGLPVPDAVVQASAGATGGVRTTVTDRKGGYHLEGLAPGSWTVVVRLPDGEMSEPRQATLQLQQSVQLDFSVGHGLSEHVVVRAETPMVDRKQTAGGLLIDLAEVESLPISGRNFTNLALLDSSVRASAPGSSFGERGSEFVVNGQSGRSNSFLVDGLDNNDQTSNTTLNAFFSQQVVQEFVLLTHQYGAEFGRASGGLLNVVTRRGSNERSWGAFVQGARENWNEPGNFVDSLPDSGESQAAASRFQAGVSAGGPIREDRAYYFVAIEHQANDDVIPYTGVDREGRPGGRMIAPNDDDNLFARLDFNLDASNTLMVRISADERTSNGLNVLGISTEEAGFSLDERDLTLAAAWTSVIGSNRVMETRFLAGKSEFSQRAYSDRPGVTRPSGIFGGNQLNRQQRDEDRFQLVENLTWQTGVHAWKFGMDVLHSQTALEAGFDPNGGFLYSSDRPFEPGDCGDPNVSLVVQPDGTIDCPGNPGVDDDMDGQIDEPANKFSYPVVYSLVVGEPREKLSDTRIALFAQDRWEAGSRFVLNYGLRYDFSTYRLPSDARVASSIPNGGAGRDYDNLAPRLGFTFTPGEGRFVLRGGAGVFYDKLVLAFPATAAVMSGTEIGLRFPQGLLDEFTETLLEEGADNTVGFAPNLTMRFSTATELETPYTVQYTLGVERAVTPHSAVRADLIRTLGYHQPLMVDLNPVVCVPDSGDPACPLLPGHPDDTTGSIAAVTTEGRTWYSGLDLKWQVKRADSWFSASYTWSKAEDLGFDPLKEGIYFPAPDYSGTGPPAVSLRGERGRTSGDREHRIVLSGDFPVPWMGIRASGVLQMSSGMPFNVTTGQDNNLDGILSERPAGVGRNQGEDSDLAAINALRASPAVGLPPISGLDEPSFSQIDLRMYKQFPISRKGGAEAFLQVFNLLGRENGGLIEGRAVSPNLGRVIGLAGPPRTLELGLKVGF